jgi:hypothetical protein
MWRGRPRPRTADSKLVRAGNSCHFLLVAICGLLLALVPQASTQRASLAHAPAPHPAATHLNSPTGGFAFGQAAYASRFQRFFPYTSLPFPFFGDSFNPDDIYSTGYPVASQPPVILLQAASGRAGSPATTEPAIPQPLLIELQNGRYVRVNSAAADGDALPLALAPDRAPSPPHDLPPALLIFRDGHSEEVRDYTIANGILYARGDYYTDGYWTKKIALSALNVAQTLEANTTRSVKFVLPASPNEVITRP